MSRPLPPFPWQHEEPKAPIYGRLATRIEHLDQAALVALVRGLALGSARVSHCSGCGADVLEPLPASGPIAGVEVPPICRPCVKAAVERGDTVMAAQPYADKPA